MRIHFYRPRKYFYNENFQIYGIPTTQRKYTQASHRSHVYVLDQWSRRTIESNLCRWLASSSLPDLCSTRALNKDREDSAGDEARDDDVGQCACGIIEHEACAAPGSHSRRLRHRTHAVYPPFRCQGKIETPGPHYHGKMGTRGPQKRRENGDPTHRRSTISERSILMHYFNVISFYNAMSEHNSYIYRVD